MNILHASATRLALAALLAAPLAACTTDTPNRGMVSEHQPVVTHDNLVYQARTDGMGGLAAGELTRLDGWLATIDLGYGDRVVVGPEAGNAGSPIRDRIAGIVARYDLLLQDGPDSELTAAADGFVRVTVMRAVASVPGCPDWHNKEEADGTGGLSSNFGCATNSNISAMIANPEDLVRGQVTPSTLRTATSSRAIQIYRDKAPTGSGDLKTLTGN